MQCYISPQTLKKQTKILTKNWTSPLQTSSARKILTALYGYKNPHHYDQCVRENDKSTQIISQEFLLQNLDYFVSRLAFLGEISPDVSLSYLTLLWKAYIPKDGFYPNYCKFSIHGTLQDFLIKKEVSEIQYGFQGSPSVKDAIEALGVPHPEIGAITVNGNRVDFSYRVQVRDKVEVYPHLYPEMSSLVSIAPEGKPQFVLDVHLGGLAKYLRMAGFDTSYQSHDIGDKALSHIAETENRIMLTRDIGLLKRSNISYGYWLRSTDPKTQFKEIVERYSLDSQFTPFTRCTKCNSIIEEVSAEEVSARKDVPEKVTKEYSVFKKCSGCHQIYWKGSHYDKMHLFLSQFK